MLKHHLTLVSNRGNCSPMRLFCLTGFHGAVQRLRLADGLLLGDGALGAEVCEISLTFHSARVLSNKVPVKRELRTSGYIYIFLNSVT